MAKDKLEDWDETAANNTDVGGISLAEGMFPSDVNNAMREMMEQVAKNIGDDTISSAITTDIGSVPGRTVTVSGTTTITGLGTIKSGTIKFVTFSGILTLTHNGTSLILPGAANITTAAGDTAVFVSLGSGNWRCVSYQKASGVATVVRDAITLGTVQATTSGTSKDFTGIPATAKRVTVNLVGVSTDGSSSLLLQLGDSGGIETTGYLGSGSVMAVSTATTIYTAGFGMETGPAYLHNASITLNLVNPASNTWAAMGTGSTSEAGRSYIISGSKSLSSTLDRVRLTTVSGTANFDAGSVNISYE